MKYIIICLFAFFSLTISTSYSQNGGDGIVVENGKKFKLHTVAAGETIYALGRKYSMSPAKIIAANGNIQTLKLGQKVKIPMSDAPVVAETPKPKVTTPVKETKPAKVEEVTTPKAAIPNYHVVEQGETISAIARKYGMTVDQVQQINSLGDNTINVGQKIFLSRGAKAKFEEDRAKEEMKKSQDINGTKPVTPEKTEEQPKTEEATPKEISQVKESGEAAWVNDADLNPNKYFALHRSAPNGTIMKVTNRMNNKFVFVKVIGKLPNTGDNNNLVIKLSQAAANKLGVLDNRFQADISYSLIEGR
ncbi:MAG: LysM peptidoglycan-binding domain-containing protein [Bacteroidetes bacterium]|nr:LysM peptidoglycan-binding domain-containing protein [Bacteroidota bacterium]